MPAKNRPFTILRYLWDHADESHPAIITELLTYLPQYKFVGTITRKG